MNGVRWRRGKEKPTFWELVDKESSPYGCWLWTGPQNGMGYGVFNYASPENPQEKLAHRYSLALLRGPITDKKEVCHNCPGGDNPLCVNPEHLWIGTHADNMRDMWAKGRAEGIRARFRQRRAICKRGHALTNDNLYVTVYGNPPVTQRICRICHLERQRVQRGKHRAHRREAARRYHAAKRDAINARKVAALAFYRKREATQRQGGAA